MKNFIPWIVVAVVVLFAAGTCSRLSNAGRELNISNANHRAAIDTTRRHLIRENQGLSRLVEQRSVSMNQIAGVLDKAQDSVVALLAVLKDRGVEHLAVVTGMKVAFDSVTKENVSLNADLITQSRTGETFRVIAIDVEGPPISGDIDISVPADTTKPAEVEFVSLVIAPFDLVYGLGCSEHDAVVVAQAPEHITLGLVPGVVDPSVCNPPPARQWFGDIFKFSPSNAAWGILGAAAVFFLGGQ